MRHMLSLALTICIGIICLSASVPAQETVDIVFESSCLWSGINKMLVHDDHVFMAMNHGLMILDISDPANPAFVWKLYLESGGGEDIAISGDYAYFGGGIAGLKIIDISNLSSPTLAAEFSGMDLGSTHVLNPGSVNTSGNLLFLGGSYGRLEIYDISTPTAPVLVGEYEDFIFGNYDNLHVVGNYALPVGVGALDISDLNNIIPVPWSIDLPGTIRDVVVRDNLAYIADDSTSCIIDISDPTAPVLVSTFGCYGRDIEVIGNYAYIANIPNTWESDGMLVFDISDPSTPVHVGTYESFAVQVAGTGTAMMVTDGYDFLDVVDISDPTLPVKSGNYFIPPSGYYGNRDIETDGRYAYVGYGDGGVQIVDIKSPKNPKYIRGDLIGSRAFNLELVGNLLYVCANAYAFDGLVIFDVTDGANPVELGSYEYASPQAVCVRGDYAFIGGNYNNSYILDISDPADIRKLGEYRQTIAWGYAATDNYLYAATFAGLETIDISTITDPVVVDTIPYINGAKDVIIYKGYLFASGQNVCKVYDIDTDPASPTYVGVIPLTNSTCYKIVPYVDYLILAGGYNEGVMVVDISNPVSPVVIGRQETSGSAMGVATYGEHAYVVDQFGLMTYSFDLPYCCLLGGDANFDGEVDMSDVIFLINLVFKDGMPFYCDESADANGDCNVSLGDPIFLINYIIRGGPEPVCSNCLK